MSSDDSFLNAAIAGYIAANSTEPDAVQKELITANSTLGEISVMQISPVQGSFMTILTGLLQPQFAVELGTFTGYSSLAVAKALPPGGRLLCCDISEEWTSIARVHWEKAGVADRIDLRIGPAIDTLRALPDEPTVDLAFVDADKASYTDYFEELVKRLSPRGVILFDNTLRGGTVADPDDNDAAEMRAFNAHVVADERVNVALLPLADGVSMISLRSG